VHEEVEPAKILDKLYIQQTRWQRDKLYCYNCLLVLLSGNGWQCL